MEDMGMILDALLIPEVGYFLIGLIFFLLLWAILKRIKALGKKMAILEIGHQEFFFQSSAMRKCRLSLISTERTDMKALQTRSAELLGFFDQLGFLVQTGIIPQKELWHFLGMPIFGYFSFLVPFIQWIRTQERDPQLYQYFEELNETIYRFNYRMDRKQAHPLMEENELNRFIEEEKATLSD